MSEAQPEDFETISVPDNLDELESERDKVNEKAGDDPKLAVNTDGDRDSDAQESDSRSAIKARAAELRAQKEQEKAAKAQKATAEAQRGTAEQNRLVKTKSGAFGEVEGFKPAYKADADADTYEEIKPASPWKKWAARN